MPWSNLQATLHFCQITIILIKNSKTPKITPKIKNDSFGIQKILRENLSQIIIGYKSPIAAVKVFIRISNLFSVFIMIIFNFMIFS